MKLEIGDKLSHWKNGDIYIVTDIGEHHDILDIFVTYEQETSGRKFVRPEMQFFQIMPNGKQRFTKVN